MAKIVYNACHGGFGLSHEAVLRYCEIKGIAVYPEKDDLMAYSWTYYLTPKDERFEQLSSEEYYALSYQDKDEYNRKYRAETLYDRDIDRTDPALVQVVEEMGKKASGRFANLKIEELSPGTLYRIEEYDGFESVVTQDGYDWRVA